MGTASRLVQPVGITNLIFGALYDPKQMARLMQQLNILKDGFNSSLAERLCGAKAADTSSTSTTLAADPDLYVALPGAGVYLLHGLAHFTFAGGLTLGMTTSNAGNTGAGEFVVSRQVGAASGLVTALALGSTLTDSTNAEGAASITGTVIAKGATTISLSWASGTAGQAATMKAGSALFARLMG